MKYPFRKSLIRTLLTVGVLALLACVAWAQGGTGELTGLVTDSTGAFVANAHVALSNKSTGDKREATTTSAGEYRFSALPVVGTYTLAITAKGFRGYSLNDVVISVGVVTNHDAQLEVGTENETITVEAGAQQIQTTESSISGLVDRRVWQDMPLETRSQNEFIGLLAGAEPAAQAELVTDRGAAVNGTRSGTGNFMVEGFDNNDQGLGGAGSSVGPGGANTTISPDAIQEYRVIEHLPAAEYGRAGGFVTDTVLKSGTNQWHGSLFEYNRVQKLAANSFFSNRAGLQDHLIRNQFGGSVGGPIARDKAFFFFTVEAHRQRTNSPLTVNTITPDFVNFVQSGQFETFVESDPNGICNNQNYLNSVFGNGVATAAPCPGAFAQNATTGPVWRKIYAAEPLPWCVPGAANCVITAFDPVTLTGSRVGESLWTGSAALGLYPVIYPVNAYGTLTVSQPGALNQMRYTGKFDQKLGAKDSLDAAYLYDNADFVTPFAGNNVMGPTAYVHERAQNGGVTWTHAFTPTILNQARAAYVRHTGNFPGDPRVLGMPAIVTAFDSPTFGFGNADNLPQFFTENEFQYRDDVSITWGKHNFKLGGEYRRTRNGSSFDSFKYGLLEPNGTEDLLTDDTFSNVLENVLFGGPVFGSIAAAEASLNPQTGGLPDYYRGYRANEYAFYGQDDWRISKNLTLNLGLRWEYFGPPHNFKPGVDSNFYTGSKSTPFTTASNNPFMPVNSPFYAGFANGSVVQKNSDIWNKDYNNFGPRVGFAYQAGGNAKTVIRGGFGMNYDRMYNNIFENFRFNPPFFAIGLLGAFGNGVAVTPAQTAAINTFPFTGTSTFAGAGLTPSIRAMNQNIVTAYYEQANLGIQKELAKDLVLETNYVGTFGHKLIGVIGANTFDGRYSSGYSHRAINTNYSNISFRTNCCDSNYHAWQTTLTKRFSGGLSFNANYTWSKAMDDVSDTFTTKNASLAAYPTDSMNPHLDYGPADFNVKHRAVVSFDYALPLAKHNRWLGGWSVSGIVSAQSGADFSVNNSSVDSNKDNQFNDRAVYTGPGLITNAIRHSSSPADGYLNPNVFGMLNADIPCPATVNQGKWCEGKALGQMERNTLVGPGYFNTDFGFAKAFRITETSNLKLMGNFFNIFNHTNFMAPDANLNDVGSTFGESTAAFSPRIVQLALRLDF